MAACGSIPEPGRPPEAHRRKYEAGRSMRNDNAARYDANFNVDAKSLLHFPTDTLRKVFFNRQATPTNNNRQHHHHQQHQHQHRIRRDSTLDGIATVSESIERPRKRHSFHQDVEEALNSLLWQPYEYQQASRTKSAASMCSYTSSAAASASSNSDYWCRSYERMYHRPSTCSSSGGTLSSSSASSVSSSSSCSGLEPPSNNGMHRSGNTADLDFLVNNLRPAHRLSQSRSPSPSRGYSALAPCSARFPPHAISTQRNIVVRALFATGELLNRCASPDAHPALNCSDANCIGQSTTTTTTTTCDVPRECATMRVEIQPPPPVSSAVKSIVVTGTTTASSAGDVPSSHGIPPPPRSTRPTVRNLSSVNVVGLPQNHPRQGSVPVTLTITPSTRATLVPQHARNISEPYRGANTAFAARTTTGPSIVALAGLPRTPANVATAANANNGVRAANTNCSEGRVPINVSNVNVNYYRAVPVNVVSAVPTIQCMNSGGGSSSGTAATSCTIVDSSHVSNVNIVQAMPLAVLGGGPTATTTCTEVIVHSTPSVLVAPSKLTEVRTFASTEAQTDETSTPECASVAVREQRRRERRERRHQRRLNVANHRHVGGVVPTQTSTVGEQQAHGISFASSSSQMPDLLNNTLPPPYNNAALLQSMTAGSQPPTQPVLQTGNIIVPPGTIVQSLVPNSLLPNGLVPSSMVPFHPQVVAAGQVPLVQAAGAIPVPVPATNGFRFSLPANGFRRSRYSEDAPKSCCGLLAWRPASLRWFIALIALVAVCCVLVGTALGAMRPSGRDHLTVSLLMIGVGIILVTVSGVAWRLTSHDSSTCRSMLGLGSTESVEACPRRFVPRLPPSYGRPHHPYAAMMYPEFQYRPPPPSYQASMQEYRLRLLLLDRGSTPQIQSGVQNPVSPPPTYRSHSGSLLRVPLSNRRDVAHSEYSCPPSYRSQNSSSRAAAMLQTNSMMHSREQSLSLSESNHDGSVVNVVNILSANEEDIALDNITLDSLKLEPEEINPLKLLLRTSASDLVEGTKDANLVTIVQTNDQSPVIVTVSGSSATDGCNTVQITEMPTEMEILAHL